MFCTDIPNPIFLIISNSVPHLLYYSHVPAMMISLLLGFFVYFKSGKSLLGKILLSISAVFFFWSFANLIVWTNSDSRLITFTWSFFGSLYSLLYVLSFYFVYVYIEKKDAPFWSKILFTVLLSPIFILSSSRYNLSFFNIPNCEISEGSHYSAYYYYLGLFIFAWIVVFASIKYKKASKDLRRQILPLTFGIGFFLLSFFITGYLSSYLDNFELEQYGLFGMTFFMGMLAFLIVRYHAFHIKLIGVQALVVSLILLIGSQFFFIQNNTNKILTGITLALATGFGYLLIKLVKREIKHEEQLEKMTKTLAFANGELRKLDDAKTEFISIASHQLRTPLTAIKGYADLMQEGSYGDVPEKFINPLQNICKSEVRLANLVEELLNVSRIEAGRMKYELKPEHIEIVLKEIYENLVLMAKGKNLFLELKLPEERLPMVSIDLKKMKEVVSNLTENAIKYTKTGGVTMEASVRNSADAEHGAVEIDGKVLRIVVSDTGIGIPAEEIPYLFKKFSRGKNIGRLQAEGTGLGLYVVKNIMDGHGGNIWIESDGAGKGTRFVVELSMVA